MFNLPDKGKSVLWGLVRCSRGSLVQIHVGTWQGSSSSVHRYLIWRPNHSRRILWDFKFLNLRMRIWKKISSYFLFIQYEWKIELFSIYIQASDRFHESVNMYPALVNSILRCVLCVLCWLCRLKTCYCQGICKNIVRVKQWALLMFS